MFYNILAIILHHRIEKGMEPMLQRTQFGFRRKCSTTDAVQCIRRIVDKGEQTDTDTILVLLDWEQAFDKIYHKGLLTALKRIGVEEKIIKIIRAMYEGATFMVEEAGRQSTWKTGVWHKTRLPALPLPIHRPHDGSLPRCPRKTTRGTRKPKGKRGNLRPGPLC